MRRRTGTEIRHEVDRVLEVVQLPHLARRYPRQLSGGQQQRIALARCIVYGPSIILMDEPLGALDKKLREQLQIEIRRLHKQLGTTILYVSHDQQETLTLSDRVCLMNHGRVEQVGTPQQLYFQPMTLFAADFLGESNLLPVEVVGEAGPALRLRCPTLGNVEVLAAARRDVPKPAHVMIRPERLSLTRNGQASDNEVGAVVEEVIFTGGVTKYFLAADGGAQLFLTAPTGHDEQEAMPGDRVTVGWAARSAVLLPAAGSA
jgi:putative spermidine/putrescine transport system ATP-binding protein